MIIKYKPLPPLHALQKNFFLDADAGTLTRLLQRQGSKPPGTIIKGAKHYRMTVYFAGDAFLLSRIIWLMATGADPGDMQVIHIDGDMSNHCFDNLRLQVPVQNNLTDSGRGKSGYKGVYLRQNAAGETRYYVQIHRTAGRDADGKYIRTTTSHGSYSTAEEAAAAYLQAIKHKTERDKALQDLQDCPAVQRAVSATSMPDARDALGTMSSQQRLAAEVALMVLGIEVADTSRTALVNALQLMTEQYP